MGLAADYTMNHATKNAAFESLELVFTVFYFFELCFRLCRFRSQYFCGPDASWNLFDFFLVVQAVAEQVQSLFDVGSSEEGDMENFTFFRLLRLLKMLKLLRLIRLMRMFR